mmetsp:Transcript_7149/g.17343  ORF Transcript_7149/g.17343 Transcript_7149/m.17343 type:complete len:541 (+) Transcript_7149:405-2027(+)|eukprot:CAMPEP_0178994532 /NCGR_PEP_ID=MMETSP0795-20121207/7323_1 /TAXON_ID=88552 /ORGANISM="Amoebophrya sp., Strain Ameob2" /LENGTH=540 /DNA_ID=CAMNT_0020686737 /DNA_START=244 /DNA_END=1866 /DNA_ORIENTATION=+
MSKGGLPAIRNSDPLGGAGPLAGLGGMDSNSLKPSPRRRELTRKEKKKLYKLDTAAQESVSESVRELKGSVESLVEHEAEWRRQKDEMKKYGQASVFASRDDRERYMKSLRKEVDDIVAPKKEPSFLPPINEGGGDLHDAAPVANGKNTNTNNANQLHHDSMVQRPTTSAAKTKPSSTLHSDGQFAHTREERKTINSRGRSASKKKRRPSRSPRGRNSTFRRSRTLATKLPDIHDKKSGQGAHRTIAPIPISNKNKANEPHRVISLKELKTPHICNAKLLKKQLEREEREEKKRLEEWHQLLAKHSKDSVKDNDRLPGGAAGQEMSSTQLVAASPEPIPDWLSTKSLSKRRYLAASTGNLHGLQAAEFNNTKWPLPKMFGQEKYAYSLIDIEDPRFVDECAGMSKQLIHYFYDQQIFDLKWRETYKQLIRAEKRRANLPALASNKAKDELDGNVKKFKKYLLELQEQRDMYQSKIDGIFERCAQIKRGIKKENDLEELRMEMTGRVKAKFAQEDGFWSTQFNCTRPDDVRGSDDDLLLSD